MLYPLTYPLLQPRVRRTPDYLLNFNKNKAMRPPTPTRSRLRLRRRSYSNLPPPPTDPFGMDANAQIVSNEPLFREVPSLEESALSMPGRRNPCHSFGQGCGVAEVVTDDGESELESARRMRVAMALERNE